jgi:hypothetical protein
MANRIFVLPIYGAGHAEAGLLGKPSALEIVGNNPAASGQRELCSRLGLMFPVFLAQR